METTRLDLYDGPGGWLCAFTRPTVDRPLEPHESIWIRLAPAADETWAPTGELYMPGVTAESIRKVPLRRILLAVNATDELRRDLEKRLDDEVPAIGSSAFLKACTGYVHKEPEQRPLAPLVLERPAGRYLSDAFYARVAETYKTAVERGEKPRSAIAAAASVSSEVAGRWVREARKRELLPATEPGKVRA
ncbi:MAG: hypothetical protein ACRDL2_10775 [Gaiellaceae bacterium]